MKNVTGTQLSKWATEALYAAQQTGDCSLICYLYSQAAALYAQEGDLPSAKFALEMVEIYKS